MHDIVASVPSIVALLLSKGRGVEGNSVCLRCAAFKPNDKVPFVSTTELLPVLAPAEPERWYVVALQVPEEATEALLSVCLGPPESSALKAKQLTVGTLDLKAFLSSSRMRMLIDPSSPEIKLVIVPRDFPPALQSKSLITNLLTAAYAFPSRNTILRESCGEVPFGYALPSEWLKLRRGELKSTIEGHERLLQDTRQAQGLFSDDDMAVRNGFFPCCIRIVGARRLEQSHRVPGSTSMSSPFVSVIITNPKKDDTVRNVGKTNTEYRTADPVFGTNSNVQQCEHAKPQTEFEPGRHGRITSDGQTMECYLSEGDVLTLTVYHERHSVYQGVTYQALSHALLRFEELNASDNQVKELELQSLSGQGHPQGILYVVAFLRRKPSSNPFDMLEMQASLPEVTPEQKVALRKIPAHWLSVLVASLKSNRSTLDTMVEEIKRREQENKGCFKSSTDKKKLGPAAITTNLHSCEFDICSTQVPFETRSRFAYTTCGVPAAIALGVKDVAQSLLELNLRLKQACSELDADNPAMRPRYDLSRLARLSPATLTPGKEIPFTQCTCPSPVLSVDGTCGSSFHGQSSRAKLGSAPVPAVSNRSSAAFRSMAATFATRITGSAQQAQSDAHLPNSAANGVNMVKVLEAWQRAAELESEAFLRETVAVSQSLAPTASAFLSEASLAVARGAIDARNWGEQILKAGFLIGWESLISTHGPEMCMLADVISVVEFLNTKCTLVVTSATSTWARIKGGEEGKVDLIIELTESDFAALFPDVGEKIARISLFVVLFAQGVNETQSLANYMNKESAARQAAINRSSISLLMKYALSFNRTVPLPVLRLNAIVENQREDEKEVDVLLMADDAVRALKGARQIMCKSGKDRTAMAVTLEQSRIGANSLDVISVRDAANLMREHGVRIRVAEKNVGSGMYSFNVLQRMALPRDYRPPVSVIQDMSTSYSKKDS